MDEDIRLTVGGTEIPLNGYVKRVFISVIQSLVSTLHCTDDGNITLTITKRTEEIQRL